MSNFELKGIENFNIFASTDPKNQKQEILNIDIKNLHHYKNHPFKLYTGERLNDMVESIKANGIFLPIIVRPVDKTNYEILSGHNRFEAAKKAGLEFVPCIIKENLSEDEAHLIVTESNLIQRSFADLSHSERAAAITTHYEAIKKQGKRSDLVLEVEKMLLIADKPLNDKENSTSSPMETKLRSDEKLGDKYGLSKATVARYLRIDKLILTIKDTIDNNEISVRAGVSLSYLNENEQTILYDFLTENQLTIDMKKAEQLKDLSVKEALTIKKIEDIFLGRNITKKPKKLTAVKIKMKKFENYFNETESEQEIENTILKALEFYYEHKGNEKNIENSNIETE